MNTGALPPLSVGQRIPCNPDSGPVVIRQACASVQGRMGSSSGILRYMSCRLCIPLYDALQWRCILRHANHGQ